MFPFSLYKGCDYWVPPIISEELESMDKEKNPVFENAEAEFYIAKKDGVTVGRIAAMVNWVEIEEQKKNKLRFGWYDTGFAHVVGNPAAVLTGAKGTGAAINHLFEGGRDWRIRAASDWPVTWD